MYSSLSFSSELSSPSSFVSWAVALTVVPDIEVDWFSLPGSVVPVDTLLEVGTWSSVFRVVVMIAADTDPSSLVVLVCGVVGSDPVLVVIAVVVGVVVVGGLS